MTKGFQRFPDFGKELRRPFAVHELCYDCAAFYDACPSWPAAKKFACRHFQPLPDVMPGTDGRRFLEKVFVPTDPAGDEEPAAQPPGTSPRPAAGRPRTAGCRHCGSERAPGHSYCSRCADSRKAHSNRQRQRRHRSRALGPAKGGRRDSGASTPPEVHKSVTREGINQRLRSWRRRAPGNTKVTTGWDRLIKAGLLANGHADSGTRF